MHSFPDLSHMAATTETPATSPVSVEVTNSSTASINHTTVVSTELSDSDAAGTSSRVASGSSSRKTISSVNRDPKAYSVVFCTTKLARDLSTILKSLGNGAIKKYLKHIFKGKNGEFQDVIEHLVQNECKGMLNRKNSNKITK